jgi:aminopeptidase N
MWIQEGICTFGDALATRELAGEEAYRQQMRATARNTQNRFPVVRGEQVDTDSTYHRDIYGKGAFFMHTLRFVVGDNIFFPALKKLATAPQYTYDNRVTTTDVEKLFSSSSGKNLKPLFDFYLYTTKKLEILVKQTGDKTYEISLLNFEDTLPFELRLSSGVQRTVISKMPLKVASNSIPVIDENVFFLKRVIYE